MRNLLIFISLITAVMTCAQTTQTGLVQEYNERAKKTPLAGVELNVRSAGNTVSDNNGEFSLRFLTLKPGEKVNVRRIEKLGYEIFNREAVEQWNINPKTPFVIIMCKADRFKKIRDNYEKVSSESYARQLKKEEAALAKLKEEGKLKDLEYEQKLVELRENYDKQLDNLENYVDRFSRIDLSEISGVEHEIIGLVQEGKIEEAIAKYEEQNFVSKYTQEVARLKEISSAIDQLSDIKVAKEQRRDSLYSAIDRQVETLRLAGGKDNFDKIEVILRDIAYSDTTAVIPMWKYLDFMASQNKFQQIEEALNTYFNQGISNHDRIKGMELRMRSFINMQNFSGHEKFISELDSLLDIEVKHDSNKEFLFENAKLYFRIGGFYMESDQVAKGLPYMKKAVELLPDSVALPSINEDFDCLNIYLESHVGYAYGNLKIGNKNLFEQISFKIKDVVFRQINKNLAISSKLKFTKSAIDIGQLLEINNQYAAADSLYLYTKSVYEEVISKDPKRYLPSIAHLYTVMGILYQKSDRVINSESAYLKALDCYTELAADLPKHCQKRMKRVYNNLSSMYLDNKLNEKAYDYATKSYSLVLELYNNEPQYYQSDYFAALIAMGRVYDALNVPDSAEYYYRESQNLNNLMFKESGNANIESFWRNSLDLPLFYLRTNQFKKAIPELIATIKNGESFIIKDSPLYQGLQSMIFLLGRTFRICGDYNEAKIILEKFIDQNPTKFLGYLELARNYAFLGNREETIRNLQTAVKCNRDALNGMEESDILFQYLNKI